MPAVSSLSAPILSEGRNIYAISVPELCSWVSRRKVKLLSKSKPNPSLSAAAQIDAMNRLTNRAKAVTSEFFETIETKESVWDYVTSKPSASLSNEYNPVVADICNFIEGPPGLSSDPDQEYILVSVDEFNAAEGELQSFTPLTKKLLSRHEAHTAR